MKGKQRHGSDHANKRRVNVIDAKVSGGEIVVTSRNVIELVVRQALAPNRADQIDCHQHQQNGANDLRPMQEAWLLACPGTCCLAAHALFVKNRLRQKLWKKSGPFRKRTCPPADDTTQPAIDIAPHLL